MNYKAKDKLKKNSEARWLLQEAITASQSLSKDANTILQGEQT